MKHLAKWMLAGVLACTLSVLPASARSNDHPKDDPKDPQTQPVPTIDNVKKGSLDDVNAIGFSENAREAGDHSIGAAENGRPGC